MKSIVMYQYVIPYVITFLFLFWKTHTPQFCKNFPNYRREVTVTMFYGLFLNAVFHNLRGKSEGMGISAFQRRPHGTAWWSPGGYSRAVSMTSINIHCFFYSLLFFFSILTVVLSSSYSALPQQLSSNHHLSWPHHVSPNCWNHKHFLSVFFNCFHCLWLISSLL